MIKLDDKTNEYLSKILSMKKDFNYLLDNICKKEGVYRGIRLKRIIYGIDEKDCNKLREQLKEVFDSYKKIKQVYG